MTKLKVIQVTQWGTEASLYQVLEVFNDQKKLSSTHSIIAGDVATFL